MISQASWRAVSGCGRASDRTPSQGQDTEPGPPGTALAPAAAQTVAPEQHRIVERKKKSVYGVAGPRNLRARTSWFRLHECSARLSPNPPRRFRESQNRLGWKRPPSSQRPGHEGSPRSEADPGTEPSALSSVFLSHSRDSQSAAPLLPGPTPPQRPRPPGPAAHAARGNGRADPKTLSPRG